MNKEYINIKGEDDEDIYADEYDISDTDERKKRQPHSLNRNINKASVFSPKHKNSNTNSYATNGKNKQLQ
jgi:hypothetical protein